MAISKREKTIALVAGAAIGIFGLNYYVLEPYLEARENVDRDLKAALKAEDDAALTKKREVRARRAWKVMSNSGLKTDRSEAEQQMINLMQAWAQESGVEFQSQKPDPVTRNDRVQVVKLRWTGIGSTQNASKLVHRIETAAIPIKVDDVQLVSRKDGTDDLTINLTVSTIWEAPEKAPGPGGPRGGAAGGNPAGGGAAATATGARAPT